MSSPINGKTVLVTGASIGIGKQIALALAEKGANLILFSRTESKLAGLSENIKTKYPGTRIYYAPVDIQDHEGVEAGVKNAVKEIGDIDILINNAGLALGAPAAFQNLSISDILQMNNTNINGLMFMTYAVLNDSFMKKKAGTILNISSITGLEVPPFPGESVYHAGKACQEAFSNALRNELSGTDIRVLVLRPGCVATNFHSLRVGHDKSQYEKFFEGFTPLEAADIARGAVFMLEQPLNVSVKALDMHRDLLQFLIENGMEGKKRIEVPIYQQSFIDSTEQALASKADENGLAALQAVLAARDRIFHIPRLSISAPPGNSRMAPASGWEYDW